MSSDAALLRRVVHFKKAEAPMPAGGIGRKQDHLVAVRARNAQVPFAGNWLWRQISTHENLAEGVGEPVENPQAGEGHHVIDAVERLAKHFRIETPLRPNLVPTRAPIHDCVTCSEETFAHARCWREILNCGRGGI
jgi:hypothetical protein